MGPMSRFMILLGTLGVLLCGCEMNYLLSQGYHQVKLLAARRSLEDVLSDPSTPELIRERIRLVQDICEFAHKELGLQSAKSYRSFIEIPGSVVAYVVSACPKDRLEPYLWRFPLLGSFPYKGFFNLQEAQREKESLEKEGLDTHLTGVSAFSALGWFADPIYSSMLRMDDMELCYTIFHELAHATVFFPDRVEFNEQFATFVGWQATVRFLTEQKGSHHATKVIQLLEEEHALAQVLKEVKDELTDLYGSPLSREEKLLRREMVFQEARMRLSRTGRARLQSLAAMEWNNASFLALWRYRYDTGELASLLSKLKGDLRALIEMVISWREQGMDPMDKLLDEIR